MGIGAYRWILRERPVGNPKSTDFELQAFDPGEPGQGEVLVKVEFHTIAPGIRPKLTGATYTEPVPIGAVIPGFGVGVVEASRSDALSVGDRVAGELGWATHARLAGQAVRPLPAALFEGGIPISAAIDLLGAPGLTAYFGLLRVAQIRKGQTVLISSAAGAVGSAAGQIARAHGCRVIGIAGSAAKCAALIEDFGFDAAIDYSREDSLSQVIRAEAPDGVDVYFDNVGGAITDAAIDAMVNYGRVVICGQTSEYNRTEPHGIKNTTEIISRRLTLSGFVLYDFAAEFDVAIQQLIALIRAGALVHRPTVIEGIDRAVDAFLSRFAAGGDGRLIVRVV